jgi:hypothetical protein
LVFERNIPLENATWRFVSAKTVGYYGRQGKGFDCFYLAVPAGGGQNAEVRT